MSSAGGRGRGSAWRRRWRLTRTSSSLDEPTSALDVSVQAQILNLLNDLQRDLEPHLLFISHDLSTIRYMCDRVNVMYLGKIVESGTKDHIFKEPMHPYTEALLSVIPVPDPEHKRDRLVLSGDVPSPVNPPSGCRFHTRCRYRQEICEMDRARPWRTRGTATWWPATSVEGHMATKRACVRSIAPFVRNREPDQEESWSEWFKGTYARYWYVLFCMFVDVVVVLEVYNRIDGLHLASSWRWWSSWPWSPCRSTSISRRGGHKGRWAPLEDVSEPVIMISESIANRESLYVRNIMPGGESI